MTTLIQHLEDHFGQIVRGWKEDDEGELPFYILQFQGGPIANVFTYSTLGLSNASLASPTPNKVIRHELIFMTRPEFCDRYSQEILSVICQLGMEALESGRAYLRHEVLGPRGVLFDDTQMTSIYVTQPVYLPDSFGIYTSPDGTARVFAWLVPITQRETEYAKIVGGRAFEDLLINVDPDLLDLDRDSIV